MKTKRCDHCKHFTALYPKYQPVEGICQLIETMPDYKFVYENCGFWEIRKNKLSHVE